MGSRARPAANAGMPWARWKYPAARYVPAIITAAASESPAQLSAYVGERSRCRGSNGSSAPAWRTVTRASRSTATAMPAHAAGVPRPSCSRISPYDSAAGPPVVSSAIGSRSGRRRTAASGGTARSAARPVRTATGTLIRNAHRQPSAVVSRPPRMTPIVAPTTPRPLHAARAILRRPGER